MGSGVSTRFLYRTNRWQEFVTPLAARVEGRAQPIGTLAKDVLKTLREPKPERDCRRFAAWMRFKWAECHPSLRDVWRNDLAIVRQQLLDIIEHRATWNAAHILGPTNVLMSREGEELVSAIRYSPAPSGSRLHRADSPVAVVLLSLLEGLATRRLFACRSCGTLRTRTPQSSRQRRCLGCVGVEAMRRARPAQDREFYLACERLRKKKTYTDRERRELIGALREVLQRGLPDRLAMQEFRKLVPRSTRGRRPHAPQRHHATRDNPRRG